MKISKIALAASAAIGIAIAAPANAAVITGNGLPTSNTALTNGDVITFESAALGSALNRTYGNVNIVGNTIVESTYGGMYNTFGSRYLQNNSGSTSSITLNFLAPVSAFAFNLGASNSNWRLAAGGQTYTFTPNTSDNSKAYYGISGVDLTSAVLTFAPGDYVLIDNITTTTTAAVPEPATWALMILGMGAVGFAMRRRKNVNMTVRFA